jgi:FdhE protein
MTLKQTAGRATVDQLRNLIRKLETIRPAYSPILGLFGPIFLAQEEARESVAVQPATMKEARLESFKLQENALVDKSDFIIDMKLAKRLFGQICTIAVRSDAKEMHPETALIQALTAKDYDPKPLFDAAINEDEDSFHATALELQASPQTLMLLAYNSIKPSLESCASVLGSYLAEDLFWQKPGCPVCGSAPVLSVLDTDGKRILICGFCWSEWSVPRIQCPVCLETDNRKLHYKVSYQEKEYRLEVCDQCQSYWKTVDTRELDRSFYAPLETLVSAHLDLYMNNDYAA